MFHRVANGQSVQFRAREWNAMLGAAGAYLSGAFDVRDGSSPTSHGVVSVRNITGSLVPAYRALALGDPVLPATAAAYPRSFAIDGVSPDPEAIDHPDHRSRVAIALRPIADGDIGPAMIRGQIALPVHVIDAGHTRARVIAGGTLQSGHYGPVRILAMPDAAASPDAISPALCLCDIDGHDGGHCLIRVPAGIPGGIAAGTYSAPTHALCTLAWPDTATAAATDVSANLAAHHRQVRVTNYGPEISYAGGKYIHARLMGGRLIPDIEYCSD